ncbi:MAG: FUSC family protein [Sarcina sp.]
MFKIFRGRELYLRTVIYILAVIVFFSCWNILGEGTAYIGATIAKGSLIMMGTDLTGNPIRSTLIFLGVFLYIGLFSFLSSLNIYTGFIINFVSIFLLAYNFSSNIKQIIWRPFVLGYLYLLVEPGTAQELPVRLITLALGALFMILTQFILNKNKAKKNLESGLKTLVEEIEKKIDIILEGKEVLTTTKFKVISSVDKIVSTVYSKKIDPFFITKDDNIVLNLALYAERLNYLLKEINVDLHNNIEKSFIEDLSSLTHEIHDLIGKKNSNDQLLNLLNNFYNKHIESAKDDYYLYEILQNLNMLKLSIENAAYNGFKVKDILFNRKLRNEISTVFKVNFKTDSLRFAFAFRLSITISVAYFIVHFLNIPKGSWIVFTIYAVMDPLIEDSKKRFPKRFKGTLLGIAIFLVVYFTVKSIVIQGIIFIGFYYVYVIAKDFGVKTMCTAVVGIGLFGIVTQEPRQGAMYRLVFMIIGIIIGYLASRYILPYNLTKSKNRIMSIYHTLSKEILDFAFNNPINDYYFKILSEKLMLSKLYESKLVARNDEEIKEFIFNQRILNNTIYFLLYSIKDNEQKDKVVEDFKKYILEVEAYNNNEIKDEVAIIKKIKRKFKNGFHEIESNEEKLLFINLYRIVIRMRESKILLEKVKGEI